MLDKKIDEILYEADGHVKGLRSGTESVYAPLIIADPSYFPDMVHQIGKVGRGYCIIQNPIKQC